MNVEENRLRTFSDWPSNAAVDCNRIARAGFYYTGRSLEVQCFLCGGKITEWNYGDQVMARHRQLDPNCPFVLNPSSTCNVPLVSSPNPLSSSSSSSSSSVSRQQPNNRNPIPAVSAAVRRSQEPRAEYRTEAQRLRSFVNWPVPMIVSPESLAKAGFYYLQEADMVECAFCRGIIMKWESGDEPDREHRIHFPTCDFYLHRENNELSTENVELGNVKLTSGTESDLTELGIQAHTAPRQPKHATYEGRLRTYQGWPESLRQTPEMLADAGFYYVGVEDQVRCFYCDGGLRNWEATDDAWTEHAKWFPKCGFVALVRGQEFIKHCIDNRPPLDPSIFAGVADNGSGDVRETHPPSLSTVTPPNIRSVTEAEIEELLNTAPALAALEIGLHVGRVKAALRQRIEQTGIPFTNADQLIEDALHVQFREDGGRSDNHTPESPSAELTNLLNQVIASRTLNDSDSNGEQFSGEHRVQENMPQGVDRGEDKVMNSKCTGTVDGNESSVEIKKRESSESCTVSLEEENRRLKEARLCKICMDKEVAVVFLPCGHLSTCVHCAPSLKHCPMCRQEIRATVRTFLA
ncbi:baculoviral IAP repeat-containing protein 7-like isoform X2 [Neodiprion fabricii]|uniref:baculoviral IAP repeat-containing protein 7-like isoform X2 n=1 Tax=Neodiprion fabricii TaxID=2872261 RepID=UPI001ED961A8|nr:baculoviral IAP repeat-containing protein 7-like isoform X2 [Neodiprion fabricii]